MAAPGNQCTAGFPNVASLGGQLGPEAASQLNRACVQLHSAGAPDAAKRLAGIDAHVGQADFAILEKLADLDLAADELSAARHRPVRWAHTLRNGSALLPLLLTWIMLGLASHAYSGELHSHPDLSTQPFLLLWEQGFGRGFLSFADVAFGDFAFLVVVLGLTVWVHAAESREARLENEVLDTLYAAMDTLEAAVQQNVIRSPASAQEWAEAAQRIINGAMEETRQLASTGHEAIQQASEKLAGIQDQGKDFIGQFSAEVQATLAAVRRDNEQFINRTATEARETLQRLVELQMAPLLKQLTDMLTELAKHQETYRAGVTDLSLGVAGIRDAARELASSAQAYDRIAESLAKNLDGIEASQREFTSKMAGTAESMATSATAMRGFESATRDMHDSVQKVATSVGTASSQFQAAMQDMRDGVGKVATTVSEDLDVVQRNLANTTTALSDSASALSTAARELRGASGGRSGTPTKRPFRLWNPRTWGR